MKRLQKRISNYFHSKEVHGIMINKKDGVQIIPMHSDYIMIKPKQAILNVVNCYYTIDYERYDDMKKACKKFDEKIKNAEIYLEELIFMKKILSRNKIYFKKVELISESNTSTGM